MRRWLIAILLILLYTNVSAQKLLVKGIVRDKATKENLGFSTIFIPQGSESIQASSDGSFSIGLDKGNYEMRVSYVGYKTKNTRINVDANKYIVIELQSTDNVLDEVVVTAKESTGLTSSSRIDRNAMSHLQPTSFSDLLELLPGNISKTPNMSAANTISLRETGNISANGTSTNSDDYNISSLGTLFMVDGAPINGDGNLQNVPQSSTDLSAPETKRNITNKGVDMRTLSTDNIESVEIVRGIPSAEYGNLTSGMVNIKRVRKATPLSGRFKADGYSKLLSVGKGFYIGKTNQVMNVDAGYLDSKEDPRNSMENYKRVNGSMLFNLRFDYPSVSLNWNPGIDYVGSFDNSKTDPDLSKNRINEYKSSYNRYAFTSNFNMMFKNISWLNGLYVNTSASYQADRLERRKQVAPQRASVAPTLFEAGEHDGKYLLSEYIADYVSDGKPVNLFLKLKLDGTSMWGATKHAYRVGSDWTYTKNYGDGQIYDITKPLSAAWTTRPRAYKDIPALQTLSFFAEDNVNVELGENSLELQAGVRSIQLPGISSAYNLSGKVFLDPRLNVKWLFPKIKIGKQNLSMYIAGGYGLTTKMPTIDYLYPQVNYSDILQLNYYDINKPLENSRVNIRTYIDDKTNYNLQPARNRKFEIRLGANLGSNSLTVTYFNERLTSGYRYSTYYRPYYYKKYDASSIVSSELQAPPSLEDLPYTDMNVLNGYNKTSNGSRLDKEGIEFQINTAKWNALSTALTITGAWFHSTYTNSQLLYSTVNDVVNNVIINDNYVGLYDSNSGRTNNSFNTNFMFHTQIKRWGLIFSTSVQCMWFVKTKRMQESGVPVKYIDVRDGELHTYTEESLKDEYLKFLVKNYNADVFKEFTIPMAAYINLKATKEIGKHLQIAAFANRIFDYLPSYISNGLTVRRSSEPYFGMELNIKL